MLKWPLRLTEMLPRDAVGSASRFPPYNAKAACPGREAASHGERPKGPKAAALPDWSPKWIILKQIVEEKAIALRALRPPRLGLCPLLAVSHCVSACPWVPCVIRPTRIRVFLLPPRPLCGTSKLSATPTGGDVYCPFAAQGIAVA